MKSFCMDLFSKGRAGSFTMWAAKFTSRGGKCFYSYFLTSHTACSLMEMKIPFGDQILQMDLIYIPFDQVNQTRLSTWLFSLQCCGLCLEIFFFVSYRVILTSTASNFGFVANYLWTALKFSPE